MATARTPIAPALTIAPGYDPEWLANALSYVSGSAGPKSLAAMGNATDPYQQLLALINQGPYNKERAAYQEYLLNNPWKAAPTPVTPTPGTDPNAPVTIDPAKMQLARQAALNKADLYLRSMGVDPSQYMDAINAEFDKVAGTASLQKDPYSVFGDDIATSVVKAENAKRTGQFNKEYENVFGTAADQQAAPSSLLDDAINGILSEQRGGAIQQLDRGKARGIYNDVGYNAGLASINAAMDAGRADLNNLGSGLIDTYRGKLDAIGDKAYNAASAANFAPDFKLDPYLAEYNDYATRLHNNAAGDLRSVLGNENFFNLPNIRSAAGSAQGALNLRDTDVATALQERHRVNAQRRGLGSQGAF